VIEPSLAEQTTQAGSAAGSTRWGFDAIIYRFAVRGVMEPGSPGSTRRQFGASDVSAVVRLGSSERLWSVVQEACEDLGGCDWEWQAADGWLGKARWVATTWGQTRPTEPRPG